MGGVERVFAPEALVVIGYAGRDRAAVEAHIDELAELGVPRPASIPLFMVFPPGLITQTPSITVAGSQTSGEAEIVVVVDGDGSPWPDTADALVRHCLDRLAYFKVPGYLARCDALPLTATEKIQRAALKALAAERLAAGDCIDTRSLKTAHG